jgi:hypothetical protein
MSRNFFGSRCALGVWAIAFVFVVSSAALAVEIPNGVTQIEEDWELIVTDPDDEVNSPQITCTMSPAGGTAGLHVTFELNHRTQPDYFDGGMQLQMWNGEDFWGVSPGAWNYSLHHDNEVVTWTQRMIVSPCCLTFEVDNGDSDSWGQFGGNGQLRVSSLVPVWDLSNYDPASSALLSGVGFGGQRVASLTLREVRYYVGSELVATDTTQRVVHTPE